jgi:hypothetical protein
MILSGTRLSSNNREYGSIAGPAIERNPHGRRVFAFLSLEHQQAAGRADITQAAAVRVDGNDTQPLLQPLGQGGDINRLSVQHETVFHVDVVGPVNAFDGLPGLAVQPESDEGTPGRRDLASAQDQAAG